MVEAVQYLAALGHRRVAHVAGVGEFVHTVQRTAAFRRATDDLGLQAEIVETDYSAESGARATRRLLSLPDAPTAIVFDSDLLAVTGLGVAQQMGFSVPDDVSIVGWDDSLISQVVHPPLTAITRDIQAFGVAAAQAPARGGRLGRRRPTSRPLRGELTPRGSTGRPAPDSVKKRLTLNRISDRVHLRELDGPRWHPTRSSISRSTASPTRPSERTPTDDLDTRRDLRTMTRRRTRRAAGAVAALAAVAAFVSLTVGGAAASEQSAFALPRAETLYTSGKQWGPYTNFNPLRPDYNTGVVGLLYETLFRYDPLKDRFLPWLATGQRWAGSNHVVTLRRGVT